MILDKLTNEQKEKMNASLGVLIMTIMVAFWTPLSFLLFECNLPLIYVSFIMVAYSAVIGHMSKYAVIVLGTPKELIPGIPVVLKPTKDTEITVEVPEEPIEEGIPE